MTVYLANNWALFFALNVFCKISNFDVGCLEGVYHTDIALKKVLTLSISSEILRFFSTADIDYPIRKWQ